MKNIFLEFYKIFKLKLPVFPDVGSISVSPGFSLPSFSASSIIRSPIRSFTEPPALKNSHLATENFKMTIFTQRKFIINSFSTQLTQFTLQSTTFANVVDSNQRSIANFLEYVCHNFRRRLSEKDTTILQLYFQTIYKL